MMTTLHSVINYGWVMESTIQDHLARVRKHLDNGRNILHSLRGPSMKTYDVPDVSIDLSILQLYPPKEHDEFVPIVLLDLLSMFLNDNA